MDKCSGVTSHRQPRQCRGPKTVKGAQSGDNVKVSLTARRAVRLRQQRFLYFQRAILLVVVVEMALYKAKKAGQTLAAQKKQEEVRTCINKASLC